MFVQRWAFPWEKGSTETNSNPIRKSRGEKVKITPPNSRTETDLSVNQAKERVYSEWEKDLQKREKSLKDRERFVRQQEVEVSAQIGCIAELKTLVVKLEQDIKSLRVENTDLRLHVESYPDRHQTGVAECMHVNINNNHSISGNMKSIVVTIIKART